MLNSRRTVVAVVVFLILSLGAISPNYGQKSTDKQKQRDSRLLQLVEANVIGTHAFQILLAKNPAKVIPAASDRLNSVTANSKHSLLIRRNY